MSRTFRVALVTTVVAATLVYTVSGSQLQGDELILNIDFWPLISVPFILGFGVWWIGKAGR